MSKIFSKKIILISAIALIVGIFLGTTTFLLIREKREARMLSEYIERLKQERVIADEVPRPETPPPLTPELERAVRRKIEEISDILAKEGWSDEIREEILGVSLLAEWVDEEIFYKARRKCLAKTLDFRQPLLGFEMTPAKVSDIGKVSVRYHTCEAMSQADISVCNKLKEIGEAEYKYCRSSYTASILPSIFEKGICGDEEINILTEFMGVSRAASLAFCEGILHNNESRCYDIEENPAMKITCLAIAKDNPGLFESIEQEELRLGAKDMFYLIKALKEDKGDYLKNITLTSYFLRALPEIQERFLRDFSCQDFAREDYQNYCEIAFPFLD